MSTAHFVVAPEYIGPLAFIVAFCAGWVLASVWVALKEMWDQWP